VTVGARSTDAIRVIGSVLRVPDLRRVEVAFAAFGLAEYSTWVAILVYAYGVAGATGAGVAALIQLLPSAVAAPIASAFSDLVGRRRSLIAGYAIQALSMGAVALALYAHAPIAAVIALATIAATSITFTRPAQWAIQVALSETPEQLTAANVMSASLGNATILAGPALAGALLAVSGPGLVFAVAAAGLAGAAVLSVRIRKPPSSSAPPPIGTIFRESGRGLARLLEEPKSRLVVEVVAVRSVCVGALDVLAVVLAISFLGIGRSGAGYLTAAFGAGALAGAAGALALVGRTSLSRPLRLGLALFGLALATIAAARSTWVAFVLLTVGGVGHAVAEVAGRTLLQRLTPETVLSRVFGVLEGLDMAGLALGSIVVALLVGALGLRWTLVIVGGLLPAVAIVTGRGLRQADLAAPVDVERLRILKAIPMFRPLDPPTLESLADGLSPLEVGSGTAVVRQGEPGDRLYVIAEGTVDVTKDGRPVAALGPGDFFGEIALLHDVPRTATVTAREPSRLFALEREPFLSALGRHSTATEQAHEVARRRSADQARR